MNRDNFGLEVVVIVLLTVVWVAIARADDGDSFLVRKNQRTFDVVRTIDDVPLNTCRYVAFPPVPIDVMYMPEAKLYCNTLGAVGYVNDEFRTDELGG